MKHLMLDLETLGHTNDAAIIQIGACVFDEDNILDEFEIAIDFENAEKYGKITGSTVRWWLQQSEEARHAITDEVKQFPLDTALNHFNDFCFRHKLNSTLYFWAHATFDFPIIQNAYNATKINSPINSIMCRDLGTAEHLLPKVDWPIRQGIAHTALSDAIYQAKGLQAMWRATNE